MSALYDLFLAEYPLSEELRGSLIRVLSAGIEASEKETPHGVNLIARENASLDEKLGKRVRKGKAEMGGLGGAGDRAGHNIRS
jgi:hypothetical protein